MKIYHKGFNFSQDGPGNRLVYHMQGCNFSCRWCSNPESMPIDSANCSEYTPEQILDEALSCRPMFFDGGGVTFTGGEPTVQFEDLMSTMKLLKANGVDTCIENNTSHPRLIELSAYVDHMICDLKCPDEAIHRRYTGASLAGVIENLIRLSNERDSILVRIPLVNGVNTDAQAFLRILKRLKLSSVSVEVLRYHEFGRNKWKTKYEIDDGFVSDKQFSDFLEALRAEGINTVEN